MNFRERQRAFAEVNNGEGAFRTMHECHNEYFRRRGATVPDNLDRLCEGKITLVSTVPKPSPELLKTTAVVGIFSRRQVRVSFIDIPREISR